jgi:hypothetical protein
MLLVLLIQISSALFKDNLLVEHEASEVFVQLLRETVILCIFSFVLHLKYLQERSRTASDVIRVFGLVKRKFLSKFIPLFLLPIFTI